MPEGFEELAVFEPGDPGSTAWKRSLDEAVRVGVEAGYLTDAAMLKALAEDFREEASAKEVKRLAGPMIEERRRALARARWPKVTDCDRLARAFAALEESGIVARENFWCCETCGSLAMADEIKRIGRKRAVRGYVFFDQQATETAVTEGLLRLAYGAKGRGKAESAAVGREVVRAVRAAGLKASWGGTLEDWVEVAMKWRRRGPLGTGSGACRA